MVKTKSDEYFFYRDLVKKRSPILFDVGANQGQSIDRFRKIFPNVITHSFEPAPELVKILEEKYSDENVPFYEIEKILNPLGYRLYCFPTVRNFKNGKLSWVDAVYVSEGIYNKNLFDGR